VSTEVDFDVLVDLFGDQMSFDLQPGRSSVGVIIKGRVLAVSDLSTTVYPGDTVKFTSARRVWTLKVPRWSMTLKEIRP
jgi:hypothetical protein